MCENARGKEGSHRASDLSIWPQTELPTLLSMDSWAPRSPENPLPQLLCSRGAHSTQRHGFPIDVNLETLKGSF